MYCASTRFTASTWLKETSRAFVSEAGEWAVHPRRRSGEMEVFSSTTSTLKPASRAQHQGVPLNFANGRGSSPDQCAS